MQNHTCHYDPETERFSGCDGHHKCECPERQSSAESHAVLASEIADLLASQYRLADLVSTIALACERGVVKNIDESWVREARAALVEVQK